ncbi:hypothetical protein EX30DRAFT_90583 [Ascodesmis nigricans]|uniref:Uncharacterized protein n=1 Tax=Ascodesmis nigricans TaxID=341454 RepID=A0A4V3SJF1_9PEZI|nr:hypothetical protein EX30DRAFT_90583 [Ascodesmis nigricans]
MRTPVSKHRSTTQRSRTLVPPDSCGKRQKEKTRIEAHSTGTTQCTTRYACSFPFPHANVYLWNRCSTSLLSSRSGFIARRVDLACQTVRTMRIVALLTVLTSVLNQRVQDLTLSCFFVDDCIQNTTHRFKKFLQYLVLGQFADAYKYLNDLIKGFFHLGVAFV